MPTESLPKRYSSEDVHRIMRHAFQLKDTSTIAYRELQEIGRAFDIDEATLEQAIAAEQAERRQRRRRDRRRHALRIHFSAYLGVNLLLIGINSLVPGPWWFQWSLIGWGIGVYCHYRAVNAPSPPSPFG
ncbi:MAG: 2TM domain-containing protein [Desulfosarcinaceae bacterium]|nr:2TM domain-containing protein [Desulfosarcinaceae bacterium]